MNPKMKLALILTMALLVTGPLVAQSPLDSDQPVGVANALSGWSTALEGDWAAVASPQKDDGELQSVGDVTLYRYRNGKWAIRQILQPAGLPALSNFGISVGLSGGTLIASSIGDHQNGLFSGAIFVYEIQEGGVWVQQDKLKGSEVEMGHRFGNATHLQGNMLLAGAYMGNGMAPKSGTAYLFEKEGDTWTETAKLDATDGEVNDYFGHAVAIIDENTVAIGAYRAEGAAEQSGAVYIFTREGEEWSQAAKLYEPGGASFDVFGYSLSSFTIPDNMSTPNHLLFVGATGTNHDAGQTGSVHLFAERDGEWVYENEILNDQVADNGHFGHSLATNPLGDLFVGATRTHAKPERQTGSVFAYRIERSDNMFSLTPNLEITASPSTSYHHFGAVVSATDRFLLVSSPYDDRDGLTNSGSIQFYSSKSVDNEQQEPEIISTFELFQNYPNPFNPTTTIRYQLPTSAEVTLRVYDLLGREVAVLVNQEMKMAGRYQLTFDAGRLASGMYLYRLTAGSQVFTKKLMVIK